MAEGTLNSSQAFEISTKSMLTEHKPGLQICNHERSHFGLDAVYCPDCKKHFYPHSKEYQRLLQRPLLLNHPDPRPGDRVSILGDRPQRIYEISRIAGGQAVCKSIDGESTRSIAFWKIRAYCAAADTSSPTAPDTPPPDPVSGAGTQPTAPDTPPPDPVSGAGTQPTALLPKSSGWVESYQPNKRKTQYFRYLWRDRGKLHHSHLPGGNIKDAKALVNVAAVEAAIAQGRSPAEILELIRSFRSGSSQHQQR